MSIEPVAMGVIEPEATLADCERALLEIKYAPLLRMLEDIQSAQSEPSPPAPRRPMHLYVIQASTGEIKIGKAADPLKRLATLQTGSPVPLKLVRVVDGAGRIEGALHRRLRNFRLHGEWFTADALIAFDGAVRRDA